MRTRMTENLELKVLSLLLAALFWLTVAGGREGEMTVKAPVRLRNLAPRLALASGAPDAIEFRVAGPKIQMLHLSGERLVAYLDLQGVGEGSVRFCDLERAIVLPEGLHVTRVYPASVELKLVRADKQK